MPDGNVLVIGSAGLDITAHSPEPLLWDTSNIGEVHSRVSGVARNIAANLAHLEVAVTLLTAVGRDALGRRILRESKQSGIQCSHIRAVSGARSSSIVSIVRDDGEPLVSINDYHVMDRIDPNYLWKHEPLFEQADMVVIDATLSSAALATVFELAERYQIRVGADATMPVLAHRLYPYLSQLYFVSPNAAETTALCGLPDPAQTRETAIDAARYLVAMGVEIAVVTLGEQGVAYADSGGGGFIRALRTQVIDPRGAGDAFSAAVIFGLLNEVQVDEAMRLGMTAASLTLQNHETVVPELSQELLYAKLVV